MADSKLQEKMRQEHMDSRRLRSSIVKKNVEKVRELIAEGVNVNWEEWEDFMTPLMFAVTFGTTEIVSMLLEAGANILAEDKDEDNALHYAEVHNKPDMTELLNSYVKKQIVK